jgi:hypothetical protein
MGFELRRLAALMGSRPCRDDAKKYAAEKELRERLEKAAKRDTARALRRIRGLKQPKRDTDDGDNPAPE